MSLGNVLATAAPIAAGYFTGGASFGAMGVGAGIAAGAATGMGIAALTGGNVLSAGIMGGLGGYGGVGIADAFSPALAQGIAGTTGATTAAANEIAMSNLTGNALGQGGMSTAAGRGLMGVATPGVAGASVNTGLQNVTSGVKGQGFSPYATPDTLGSSATQFSTTGGYSPSAASNIGSVQTPNYVNTALTSDPSKQMLQRGVNTSVRNVDGSFAQIAQRPDFSPIAGSNVAEGAMPGGYVDTSFSAGLERLGDGSTSKGAMKLGLAGLPILAAAYEPETFTDEQMREAESYDPYETLNLNDPALDSGIAESLNEDSGLRLYAKEGGMVPTYAEGGEVERNQRARQGMNDALARNKGTAYAQPITNVASNASSNVNIAGADNSTSNIRGGVGSLNVNSGAIGQSPNAVAAAALRDTKFKMLNGYEVPLDFTPATERQGNVFSGYTPATQASHTYNSASKQWEKSKPIQPTFRIGGDNGSTLNAYNAPFSGYGGPEAGIAQFAEGGYLGGGDVNVQGDGMSDDIPANIDNEQPAALSEGEFVVPADVVSHIGNGSSEAGAKEFYGMMDRVRMARTGRKKQSPEIDPERFMPA